MDFYLNGFYPGDPEIVPVAGERARPQLEDVGEVDVLIVGSGPAGLVLAAQLARFPQIDTRIVERRDGPLLRGQADGVACRTVEMFEAFELSERLLKEAYWVNETAFWSPDTEGGRGIVRSGRIRDTEDGMSEFPHVIVNQARMQDYLLGSMQRNASRLTPDYGVSFEALALRPGTSHPVHVTLNGARRPLHVDARYVVGCDGARSAVREAIGRRLVGDVANHAWGVMDVLAVTDFPDFRLKCLIQSAASGSIVLIPREGGHLVRMYVDLGEVTDANHARIRSTTAADIARAAAAVLHPYTLDVREVAWFSVYEVAQRLTDAFDDTAGRGGLPHVFIAGDACHTHSAKAGQGMNVAMQDAFNLGWKLAAVLEGRSAPTLLSSYSAERQPVASELIDFDRKWSAMIASAPQDPAHPEQGGVDPADVQDYFVRQGRYTAGVATRYTRSLLTAAPTHQELAPGFELGTRLHSAMVVRVGDAKRVQLGHAARADGRWRLYAFADRDETLLHALCAWLAEDPASPVRRFTPAGADIDACIDVRAILQRGHRDVVLAELPALLHPHKGRLCLMDYEKVFSAQMSDARSIFELRGISRECGCMVVVRPDQFVAHVLTLDGFAELSAFFGEIMLVPASVSDAHATVR